METASHDYRELLRQELETRCKRNGSYSLRAFARDLGFFPSRISDILHGKQGLSAAAAKKMAKRLGLSSRETQWFLTDVERQHGRSQTRRATAAKKIESFALQPSHRSLDDAQFSIVADWYHFAILELTDVVDFDPAPAAIAKRLGITPHQVEQAIRRLLTCGLLKQEGTRIVATSSPASPDGVPSAAVKAFHVQTLERAETALFEQSVEDRDFSALTVAVDPADLPRMREDLRKFRDAFEARYKAAPGKKAVYCLAIQLFSLTGARKP